MGTTEERAIFCLTRRKNLVFVPTKRYLVKVFGAKRALAQMGTAFPAQSGVIKFKMGTKANKMTPD